MEAYKADVAVIGDGGTGRVFRDNTNRGIVTGDGMAIAYRHGGPLRDMEFVRHHPTRILCRPDPDRFA